MSSKSSQVAALYMLLVLLLSGCNHIGGGAERYRVLLFTKTADNRHESIEVGISAVKKLGKGNGFRVDATENAAAFSTANLEQYKLVIFLNTSGNVLNNTQQAAFENYIAAGGGYVGVHGASATEFDWTWYGLLVGAFFDDHPKKQDAIVVIRDKEHPSTAGLPGRWSRNDEWYNFRTELADHVTVLATVDESTYEGGKHGDNHPIAWCQIFEGGRSWYTAMGHGEEHYGDPYFLQHLLGGIEHVAGF